MHMELSHNYKAEVLYKLHSFGFEDIAITF